MNTITTTGRDEQLNLGDWVTKNSLPLNHEYSSDFDHIINFILYIPDIVMRYHDPEKWERVTQSIKVISTYESCRITLPLCEINFPDGTKFIVSNDFIKWTVSVESPAAITKNFQGTINYEKPLSYLECKGFTAKQVFPPYTNNSHRFTATFINNYILHTFLWILSYPD